MTNRMKLMCGSMLSATVALGVAPMARAADTAAAPAATSDGNTIAELIVTAERRAENLQKVPIAITALGPEKARALQTSGDIGKFVPNIQAEQTSGFGFNRLGI